jgi:RNA polymerase sigma-70 factor, ECF subfamily
MGDHDSVLRDAAFGDDEALAQLVREYHDRVYRFGLRACRDSFDADDAVQEAFVKLARRPDVQRDRGVLSWLMTTVRHTCMRLLRPFARERRLGDRAELDEVADAAPSPERALERWRLVALVHAAIAKLPPTYREILVLRDLEGLSGEEAARALHISEASMKSRLHRARSMIRDALLREVDADDLGEVH